MSRLRNRELLHFKMLHDCGSEILRDLPADQRAIAEEKNRILKQVYGPVTKLIMQEHIENPFSRVYHEGFDGHYKNKNQILQEDFSCLDPVRALVESGCSFELTEHSGYNTLLVAYNNRLGGYQKAAEYLNFDAEGKTIEEIVQEIQGYTKHLPIIKEFLQGEGLFNFHLIREKWMGRNIDNTLRENERGILFLGRNHSGDAIKNQLINCQYSVLDPFAPWYENSQ